MLEGLIVLAIVLIAGFTVARQLSHRAKSGCCGRCDQCHESSPSTEEPPAPPSAS